MKLTLLEHKLLRIVYRVHYAWAAGTTDDRTHFAPSPLSEVRWQSFMDFGKDADRGGRDREAEWMHEELDKFLAFHVYDCTDGILVLDDADRKEAMDMLTTNRLQGVARN